MEHTVKKTVQVLNRPHNKPLYDLTKQLLEERAAEMLRQEKGFTPGFSMRLKVYVLDELAALFGERTPSHLIAADEAWREYAARDRKRRDSKKS